MKYDEWTTFSFTRIKLYHKKLSKMIMWFVNPLSGRQKLNYYST